MNRDEDVRSAFLRLSDRLDSAGTLDALGDWLVKHTTLEGRPWSFKDHEFQLDIVNCTAPHAVTQKPTQVGLTELSLRIALALCGMKQYFGLIYTFPSAKFAREVTKTRVDPIIEGSKRLSDLVVKGSDGSEMKRIGTSTFYMGGAATKSQAISRPVKGLIFDEKDFSNQQVLTAYFGRLRHVLEEDRIVREFSTPTVAGYGINADLVKSTRQRYLVKCSKCGTRQAPDFRTQVTIPGWDKDDFAFFTKDDLLNPKLDIDGAYIRCQKCGASLDRDLANASLREWVANHPDRDWVGFEVKPFDLMKFNSIPGLIRDFGKYSDETDYWNFVQGEVHESDTNQVSKEVMDNRFTAPMDVNNPDLCFGVDVGRRYLYLVAGYRVYEQGKTRTKVVFRRRLDIKDGPFPEQVSALVDALSPAAGAMDIGPDSTLSRAFTGMGERLYAAEYKGETKGTMDYWDVNESTKVVKVQRTKGFNTLVKEMNDGLWEFSPGEDKSTVLIHLGGMKRVSQEDDEGTLRQTWVKMPNQEDHYLHACMYLKTALDVIGSSSNDSSIGVLPMPSGVRIGSRANVRV